MDNFTSLKWMLGTAKVSDGNRKTGMRGGWGWGRGRKVEGKMGKIPFPEVTLAIPSLPLLQK